MIALIPEGIRAFFARTVRETVAHANFRGEKWEAKPWQEMVIDAKSRILT